jgi:hypothetical protein
MSYIYIAGPYSKGDPVKNTADVIRTADYLAMRGHKPYVPHLTLFWHFMIQHDIQFWYDLDLAWLGKCDCLLRLPGESSGADKEIEFAEHYKMPVYHSIAECLDGEGGMK